MISNFIHAALKKASYEKLEDGRFYGAIADLPGVWNEADNLERCREELIEVLEEWIALSYRRGDKIPVFDGCDINLVTENA